MHLITLARYFRHLRRHKAIGLTLVLNMLLLSVLGNALCFYFFDSQHHDGLTFGDALWYSIISITTIGYGDYSAVSLGARLGTFLFVVIGGLGSFSVLLGMAIDWVANYSMREVRGMSQIVAENHILIVNFPSLARVVQLIEELQADPQYGGAEIVIVADNLDTMPISNSRVLFVNGPILEQETYDRAKIGAAKLAIVLATSYGDPNSDAVVASAVAVIDSLNSDIYVVAECLNPKHRMLFDSVHSNAIVHSLSISGNLFAQEVHDPGVAQMMDVITSNQRGTTLFSTEATTSTETSYKDLAIELLHRDINLICVNRGNDSLTAFASLDPSEGDRVIYAASQRVTWEEIISAAPPLPRS